MPASRFSKHMSPPNEITPEHNEFHTSIKGLTTNTLWIVAVVREGQVGGQGLLALQKYHYQDPAKNQNQIQKSKHFPPLVWTKFPHKALFKSFTFSRYWFEFLIVYTFFCVLFSFFYREYLNQNFLFKGLRNNDSTVRLCPRYSHDTSRLELRIALVNLEKFVSASEFLSTTLPLCSTRKQLSCLTIFIVSGCLLWTNGTWRMCWIFVGPKGAESFVVTSFLCLCWVFCFSFGLSVYPHQPYIFQRIKWN